MVESVDFSKEMGLLGLGGKRGKGNKMFLEIKTFFKGTVDELMASPFHTMTKTGDTKDRREMKDGECGESFRNRI